MVRKSDRSVDNQTYIKYIYSCIIIHQTSFRVKFTHVVPAETRVGCLQVVVVVDVLVPDDSGELDVVHLLPSQQIHLPQLLHPFHQRLAFFNAVGMWTQRMQHTTLKVGVFHLLLEQAVELAPSFGVDGV